MCVPSCGHTLASAIHKQHEHFVCLSMLVCMVPLPDDKLKGAWERGCVDTLCNPYVRNYIFYNLVSEWTARKLMDAINGVVVK